MYLFNSVLHLKTIFKFHLSNFRTLYLNFNYPTNLPVWTKFLGANRKFESNRVNFESQNINFERALGPRYLLNWNKVFCRYANYLIIQSNYQSSILLLYLHVLYCLGQYTWEWRLSQRSFKPSGTKLILIMCRMNVPKKRQF